jgi:acyl carrier protein
MIETGGLEREVAAMLVEAANLDVEPVEIDPIEPLFGTGLGLDSIDALELSLSISARYGFKIRATQAGQQDIFANLRSLSRYIEANRQR